MFAALADSLPKALAALLRVISPAALNLVWPAFRTPVWVMDPSVLRISSAVKLTLPSMKPRVLLMLAKAPVISILPANMLGNASRAMVSAVNWVLPITLTDAPIWRIKSALRSRLPVVAEVPRIRVPESVMETLLPWKATASVNWFSGLVRTMPWVETRLLVPATMTGRAVWVRSATNKISVRLIFRLPAAVTPSSTRPSTSARVMLLPLSLTLLKVLVPPSKISPAPALKVARPVWTVIGPV